MLVKLILSLLAAVLICCNVRAAVLDAAPSGFTVSNSETVATSPKQTWRALVGKIDRWWPRDHTWWGKESKLSLSDRVGGCFCEKNGAQQAGHMSVAFVDPPQLLRMTGGLGPLQGMGLSGALEFRLEAQPDGGTRITLYYRAGGYSPDDLSKFAPVVDQVQALQLKGLADYLRGR